MRLNRQTNIAQRFNENERQSKGNSESRGREWDG